MTAITYPAKVKSKNDELFIGNWQIEKAIADIKYPAKAAKIYN